ncbi:MAG TPA: ABC transporter ATP-binding protein [Candidatus Thermoplasmatota archaeon]|nr:ABC transporter ATP-binding protein [Candidatus Thermoplasmatota archaeon]
MADVEKDPAIEARGLTKSYGELAAVDGIDLSIRRGECFGILGPNGAGKTSFLRMVYGRFPPTRGELRVLGRSVADNPRAVKARMGVAPQDNNLDSELTVEGNLRMYARFFAVPPRQAADRAGKLLEFVELAHKRDAMVQTLSGGMKRRLVLARALVNEPDLLVLDEPTAGLDPQARSLVWKKLRDLARQGTTILLTTHYMEEAEQLCDRVAILHQGRVIALGAPAALVAREIGREVVELETPPSRHGDVLATLDGRLRGHEVLGSRLYLHVEDGEAAIERVRAAGIPIDEGRFRRASLEDVFLKLAGRRLSE